MTPEQIYKKKIQILMPCIERWYCVDLMLRNFKLMEKPDGFHFSFLAAITNGGKYGDYLTKGLKKIFHQVESFEIINNNVLQHDDIRKGKINPQLSRKKALDVYHAYDELMKRLDPTADYYLIVEDDTLFPLNSIPRYLSLMEPLNASVLSGISFTWEPVSNHGNYMNFWEFGGRRDEIGGKEQTGELPRNLIEIINMPYQKAGIAKLGAAGLGNVFIKGEVLRGWKPMDYIKLLGGADHAFFYYCEQNNYNAYGLWDHYLPHITKHENGDIEILGRIDNSLIKMLGGR